MLAALFFAVVAHLGFLVAAFLFWSDEPVFAELDLSDRFMKVIVEEPPPRRRSVEEEEDEDVGKSGRRRRPVHEEDELRKPRQTNRNS